MEIPQGRVVIELAPHFAPASAANIRVLAKRATSTGLAHHAGAGQLRRAVGRSGREEPEEPGRGEEDDCARNSRAPERHRFREAPDRDTYAPETGFSAGFAAARDPKAGRAWLVHCYGVVGVGRDNAEDSGNGAELYAIIGNAPRLLDRNITVVGRVVQGIDLLSPLKRGTGPLGFYEKPRSAPHPRGEARLGMPADKAHAAGGAAHRQQDIRHLIEMRRFRKDDWYKVPAEHVDVCNVPLPVRVRRE
jgi:peptidylprolyl isomerase